MSLALAALEGARRQVASRALAETAERPAAAAVVVEARRIAAARRAMAAWAGRGGFMCLSYFEGWR